MLLLMVTGSEKTMMILSPNPTFPAPSFGVELTTVGAVSGGNTPFAVSEKSSTDRPSSAPGIKSESAQRSQKVAPLGMFKPVIVNEIAVRFGATLPFSAPTVPATTGLAKSRLSASVQVPVVMPVASVLSWKSSLSAERPDVFWPRRHCSPVYAMASDVIVPLLLLVNCAPISGTREPLRRPPKARSLLLAAPKL